jgi:hypothetical protein
MVAGDLYFVGLEAGPTCLVLFGRVRAGTTRSSAPIGFMKSPGPATNRRGCYNTLPGRRIKGLSAARAAEQAR